MVLDFRSNVLVIYERQDNSILFYFMLRIVVGLIFW